MTDKERMKELEDIVQKFLNPIKDAPYSLLIESITGHEVLPFNKDAPDDKALLERLEEAMHNSLQKAHEEGMESVRRNEIGNHIEPFVKSALRDLGIQAEIPKNSQGNRQAVGYPDIEIKDIDGRMTYLECKTYQQSTLNSSMRSFYLQASKNSKITCPARHLMVSFEIEEALRGNRKVFMPVSWQLYTLEKLRVQIKHEINASNKDLYKESALLAKGVI